MTTALDICTDALRRLRMVSLGETPRANYTEHALTRLNDMMYGWKSQHIDVLLSADFELTDDFVFFVPPTSLEWYTLDALAYQATWDANANTPTLATGTGTNGYVYKVATAGSTTLDDVTSWAVNDFAVFDGRACVWRKGLSSRRFENGIKAMLAMEMVHDIGREPRAGTARLADECMRDLEAAFIRPPTNQIHDSALVRAPSNRYQDYISSTEAGS